MTDLPRSMTTAELRVYRETGRVPGSDRQIATDAAGAVIPPKRHKYGVGPRHLRQLDGYTFDSIAERKRYEELRALELAGSIRDLRVHPEFALVVNDEPICEYRGDFAYRLADGKWVVEDVKGARTRVYAMKRKLMRALHGIEITEVEVNR